MEDDGGSAVNTEDVSLPKVLRKATEKKLKSHLKNNDKEQRIVN